MSRCLPIALLAGACISMDVAALDLVPSKQFSIYGRLGADVYFADNGDDSSFGLASADSYLGFSGRHNLEQEYRLIWQIEQSVNLDEGGDTFASRNTFLALQKQSIEVLVGHYDTPFRKAIEPVTHLAGTFADVRGVMGSSPFGPNDSFNSRAENAVQVTWRASENVDVIGFFSGDTASGGSVNIDDNDDGQLNAIAVFYKQGPLQVRGAWQSQEVGDASGVRIVGQYEMDGITWGGAFESISSDPTLANTTPDRSALALNAKFRWKPDTDLVGQLVLANEDALDDSGATHLSVGVIQQIDPRLEVYGVFGILENESTAAYGLGFDRSDRVLATSGGEDAMGLAVGAVFEF